ncbi:hypothetical protein C7Y72_02810 [Paraconexibacter algicola]|uniref:Uncharacterized protein n=2 Tax=Paraconexibacter algicola TaxID=2133960 RepID=A0A2T4UHD2_9ACTN|nr:hypothetical protein C7Y72_02810 [Paraconexibacter algicola]
MDGFGGLFGDPEELQKRMAEFADQMQGQQRLAWADNAIKLAVDMTVAAVNRINLQGDAEAQAQQIRQVMAVVFPEAVTLVREARQGLQ